MEGPEFAEEEGALVTSTGEMNSGTAREIV